MLMRERREIADLSRYPMKIVVPESVLLKRQTADEVKRTCTICGTAFAVERKLHRAKYCSSKCKYVADEEAQRVRRMKRKLDRNNGGV